jgi:hypothetical protein
VRGHVDMSARLFGCPHFAAGCLCKTARISPLTPLKTFSGLVLHTTGVGTFAPTAAVATQKVMDEMAGIPERCVAASKPFFWPYHFLVLGVGPLSQANVRASY